MIEAIDLYKAYREVPAVCGVSFKVEPGELFGLLGPNGAGKTTILHMMSGLLRPDRGEIRILGKTVHPSELDFRYSVGFVPQDLAVYPELKVSENLHFFGHLYRQRGKALSARIGEVLEITGLKEVANRPVQQLSWGMKRRLNLGVALIHDPEVFLLDEPTLGLDTESRHQVLHYLQDLARKGRSILFAGHYLEEIQVFCRRVAIMEQGKILACAEVAALLDRVTRTVEIIAWGDPGRLTAPGNWQMRPSENNRYHISLATNAPGRESAAGALTSALRLLQESGWSVQSVSMPEPSLHKLYLQLTSAGSRN